MSRYDEARRVFRQVYDPTMKCRRSSRNVTGCTSDVTEYYFSDGGKLPLCTECVKVAPVVGDEGNEGDEVRLMSVQYYDQVYHPDLSEE